MQDRRMVAVIIEFSGGINANSGRNKESKDLDKLLPAMKQMNQYRDVSYPIPVFLQAINREHRTHWTRQRSARSQNGHMRRGRRENSGTSKRKTAHARNHFSYFRFSSKTKIRLYSIQQGR